MLQWSVLPWCVLCRRLTAIELLLLSLFLMLVSVVLYTVLRVLGSEGLVRRVIFGPALGAVRCLAPLVSVVKRVILWFWCCCFWF